MDDILAGLSQQSIGSDLGRHIQSLEELNHRIHEAKEQLGAMYNQRRVLKKQIEIGRALNAPTAPHPTLSRTANFTPPSNHNVSLVSDEHSEFSLQPLRTAGGRDRTGRQDTRGPSQVRVDGWKTPVRHQATKAGDLSRFGKISKPSTTWQFGPSSVFSRSDKRELTSATRASSSANMFAALNSNEATPNTVCIGSRTVDSTRPPIRKSSVDFSVSSIDGRRKLLLQPRTQAVASDTGSFRDGAGSAIGQSEHEAMSAASSMAPASITANQAKRKIKGDVKELFMLRQPSEAESYFSSLPSEFRWQLIEELVTKAIDAKQADVKLVSEAFSVAISKSLVEEAQFLQGFAKEMEYLEDTSTDSPNAYANVASLLKAANLSQAAIEGLADRILVEGEMAITPKEKLLKKYVALMT